MRRTRLAVKILGTLIKDRMYHPDRLISDTFAIVARCGVVLILYRYVFRLKGGEVNGIGYDVVAWSMFIYFSFSVFRLRDISRTIMEDVKSGNVEVLFNKPISYLAYRAWWQIGSGAYSFLVTSVFGGLVLAASIGIPESMRLPLFVPSLLLAYIGAIVLSLALYAIVGLAAFWMEEINPLFWMVDKSVMILGGSYLPVAMFPAFMYKLAVWSPFGASQFISHSVHDSWRTDWLGLLSIQAFWIVLLSAVVVAMYAGARKRVSINGG